MACPETDRFVKNWNRIHKQSAAALAAATDDKLDFRPLEGMFTLRELIRHIPEAESQIVRTALAGSMRDSEIDLSSANAEQILNTFRQSHQRLAAEVAALTREQLDEEIEAFGQRMRRITLLWSMTEHEIHHRGQLYTYYHLAGIEPPSLY